MTKTMCEGKGHADKNPEANVPPGYDASKFPAFAVTVDVVILTMAEGVLHVLLVRRGEEPFKGMWAIPGGFKRPEETLDEAARRELSEETGVDVPSLLTQFGAYGDPGRDPRMNVVTVAYVAVLRDVGAIAAGTDAAHAALVPVADILEERIELAFDHLRIVRDAVERVRVELEVSGIATAFVGTTFTMAELRAVYEAIWGVQLDAANFRRSLVGEDGWVIPTGRTARPGPRRRKARRALPRRPGMEARHTHPSHPAQPRGSHRMRAVVHDRYGPPEVLRVADVERPVPKDDEVLVRVHASTVTRSDADARAQRRVPVHPCLHRHPPPEANDRRHGVRGRRRGGRRGRDRVPGRRRRVRHRGRRERGVRGRARERRDRAQAEQG